MSEKGGYIVLDFETTGFPESGGEVLQIAVINDKDETLMSELCRPENVTEWKEAQAIHGITPEMVKDKPTFKELLPKLKEIIDSVAAVVIYNVGFERGILRFTYGVELEVPLIDAMEMFAEVYGDWSEYWQTYRFQKLETAARYYGYEYKAHDALEDVRATRFVYEKMKEAGVADIAY